MSEKTMNYNNNDGWVSKKHLLKNYIYPNGIIVNKDTNIRKSEQYLCTPYNDDAKIWPKPTKRNNDVWLEQQSGKLLPQTETVKIFKKDSLGRNIGIKGEIEKKITRTPEQIEQIIANAPDYEIDKYTEHLTNYFFNHGDENRKFCNADVSKNQMVDGYLLKTHFKRLNTEDLKHLKSFYFKCLACYGAYYDGHTTVFEEIQKKLKEIPNNMNKPKCFVRLLKKEYSGFLISELNKKTQKERFKSLPLKHGEYIDLDDVYENPDNYFDYYYVTEKEIFKVPHSLVHNRVELIENDYFNKEVNYNFHNNFPDDKDLKLMDERGNFYKKGWEQSFSEFKQAHPEARICRLRLKIPNALASKQLNNNKAEKHENKNDVGNKLG